MTAQTAEPDIASVLKRLADVLEKPAIPVQHQWWDAKSVAAYIGVKSRTVVDCYAHRPGFPKAARLPSESGLGPLRWPAKEVMQWMERQR